MSNEEFKILMHQYEKLIFTICYRFVRDYHEAQNLTQETFLSAYTHINTCNENNYKPWLARIATNKAKDSLKSAYSRRVLLNENEDDDKKVISLVHQPENLLLECESEEEIKQKIYSLKEPYLKVSIMYFVEDKSFDEIAEALKRPKKTVQTQILRAKGILRKLLEKGD